MSQKVIRWREDLGSPTKPGTYHVNGLGEVTVLQAEINAVPQGSNPKVEIDEITSRGNLDVRSFILGQFIPS